VADLRLACERESPRLLDLTRALVECESPSTDKPALDTCAALLAARLADAGASVTRLPGGATADHVRADWTGQGPRVLLIGHFDTVWPIGQIDRMPIHEQDGKLFGPGVLDMKAGLAIAVTAASVVYRSLPPASRPHVTLLATSDEEVGSASSRAAIEALARESQAVLVFEPALPGGAVKTARKGVGEFEIVVTGISAHAGANPLAGASAIHELARLITAIEGLNDPARGVTVNVGVVDGGTRSNVVAERARALVDVRIARLADAASVSAAFAALHARDPRVTVTVRGGINRPPMERSDGVATLYALAHEVAAGLEMRLEEGATGGASDGNFTAALGVPTLDGLGALGDGPHALHEHVIVDALCGRAALAAGILARLAQVT
jgi:glutamate carboxypeptidase